jgi:hypothetical protein
MIMRWIWRALAVFLGKKAWEAYQRRQDGGQSRSDAQRSR